MARSSPDAASLRPAPVCHGEAHSQTQACEASSAVPPLPGGSSSAGALLSTWSHTHCDDDEAPIPHQPSLFTSPLLQNPALYTLSPAAAACSSLVSRPSAATLSAAAAGGPSAPAARHSGPAPLLCLPPSAAAPSHSRTSAAATASCIPPASTGASASVFAVAAVPPAADAAAATVPAVFDASTAAVHAADDTGATVIVPGAADGAATATVPGLGDAAGAAADAGATEAGSAAEPSPRAVTSSSLRRLFTTVCSWPGRSCCSRSITGEVSDAVLLLLLSLSAASPHFFRHFLAALQLFLARDPALHYSNVYHGLLLSLLELPAIPTAIITGACSSISSSGYSSDSWNNCSNRSTRRSSGTSRNSRRFSALDSSFPSCAVVPLLEDTQPLVSLTLRKDAGVSCDTSSSSHSSSSHSSSSSSGTTCHWSGGSREARGRDGGSGCCVSSRDSSSGYAAGSSTYENVVRRGSVMCVGCEERGRGRLCCSTAKRRVTLPATAPLQLVAAAVVCWIGQLLFSLSLVVFSSFAAAAVAVTLAGAGGGAVVVLQRAALVTLFPQTPAGAIAVSVACSATAKALGRVGPAAAAAAFAVLRHGRVSSNSSSGGGGRDNTGANVTAGRQHEQAPQQEQQVLRLRLDRTAAAEEQLPQQQDMPAVGQYRVLLLGAALVCGISVAAACYAASLLRRAQATAAERMLREEAAQAAAEAGGGEEVDDEGEAAGTAAAAGTFAAVEAEDAAAPEELGATVAEEEEAAAAESAATRREEEREEERRAGEREEEASPDREREAAALAALPIFDGKTNAEGMWHAPGEMPQRRNAAADNCRQQGMQAPAALSSPHALNGDVDNQTAQCTPPAAAWSSSSRKSSGSTGTSRRDREVGAVADSFLSHQSYPMHAASTELEFSVLGFSQPEDMQEGIFTCTAQELRGTRLNDAGQWQQHEALPQVCLEREHAQQQPEDPAVLQLRHAEEQQPQQEENSLMGRRKKEKDEEEQHMLQKRTVLLQETHQGLQEPLQRKCMDEDAQQHEKAFKQQRMQVSGTASLQRQERREEEETAAAECHTSEGSSFGESVLHTRGPSSPFLWATDEEERSSSSSCRQLGVRVTHVSSSSGSWRIPERSSCGSPGQGLGNVSKSERDSNASSKKSSSGTCRCPTTSVRRRSVSQSSSNSVAQEREREDGRQRGRRDSRGGQAQPRKTALHLQRRWLRGSSFWERVMALQQLRQSSKRRRSSSSDRGGRRKSFFAGVDGSLGSSFWMLVVLHALTVATGHCFLSFAASIFHRIYRTTFVHAAVFAAVITITTLVVLPAVAYLVDRCGGSLAVVGVGLLLMWLVFCGTIALHRAQESAEAGSTAAAAAEGTQGGGTYLLTPTAAPAPALSPASGTATAVAVEKSSAAVQADAHPFTSPSLSASHSRSAASDATASGAKAAAQTAAPAAAEGPQGRSRSRHAPASYSPTADTAAGATAAGKGERPADVLPAVSCRGEPVGHRSNSRSGGPGQAGDVAAADLAADISTVTGWRAELADTTAAAAAAGETETEADRRAAAASQAPAAARIAAALRASHPATPETRAATDAATTGRSSSKFAFLGDALSPRNKRRVSSVVAATAAVDARGSRTFLFSAPKEGAVAAAGFPSSLLVANTQIPSSTAARTDPVAALAVAYQSSTSSSSARENGVAAAPSFSSPTGSRTAAAAGVNWSPVDEDPRYAAVTGESAAVACCTEREDNTRARSSEEESAAVAAAARHSTGRDDNAEDRNSPAALVVIPLNVAVKSTPRVNYETLNNSSSSNKKKRKDDTRDRRGSCKRPSSTRRDDNSSSKNSVSSLKGEQREDDNNRSRHKRLVSTSRNRKADLSSGARREGPVKSSSIDGSTAERTPGSEGETDLLRSPAAAAEQREERYWALVAAVVFGVTEAVLPTVLMALVAQPHIVRETNLYPLAFGIIEVVKCGAVAVVDALFGFVVDHRGGSYVAGLWFLCFLTVLAVLPLALLMKRDAKEAKKLCLLQRKNSLPLLPFPD